MIAGGTVAKKLLFLVAFSLLYVPGLAQHQHHYKRYILLNDTLKTKAITLIDTTYGMNTQILVYNVFFTRIDQLGKARKYLHLLSILPDESYHYPMKIEISELELQQYSINSDSLFTSTSKSVDEYNAEENDLFATRQAIVTQHIYPVVKEDGKYFTYANTIMNEIFSLPTDKDTCRSALRGSINIAQKVQTVDDIEAHNAVKRKELVKKGVKINTYYSLINNRLFFSGRVNSCIYQFWYDPTGSLDGPPKDGIIDFYYTPSLGIIGGSYEYYFDRLYNWIPGIHRARKVVFCATGIDGYTICRYMELFHK